MKKWYNEEYEFEIEVTGFLRGDHTEHYCRNGEEVGDQYTCTYGCPVNKVLSVKLDAPAPCRLDAPDLDLICYASADCLHQHLQVI